MWNFDHTEPVEADVPVPWHFERRKTVLLDTTPAGCKKEINAQDFSRAPVASLRNVLRLDCVRAF